MTRFAMDLQSVMSADEVGAVRMVQARGSGMARIRSRKYSGREVPMPTRDSRISPTRRRARQKKVEDFLTRAAGLPVECVGSGYEYPHRASTAGMRADIRYKAGLTADHMVGEV